MSAPSTRAERLAELLDPTFVRRLERLELNARKLASGERRGETPTRRRGPGTLFREHREYVPGDDLRFLDWNAFLRLGDLQVKEFDAEQVPRLLIFIDASASMGLAEGRKLRCALRLAAALGYVALSRHAAVLLTAFPARVAPRLFQSRGQTTAFLEALADLEAEGETHFIEAFRRACAPGRPSGLAVVISDFLETEEFSPALRYLRHRGCQVHGLHLLDPKEDAVRIGDTVDLVDVETQRTRRERVDAALARAYDETVAQHYRAVESSLRELSGTYLKVDVNQPVEQTVLELLKRGAVVR